MTCRMCSAPRRVRGLCRNCYERCRRKGILDDVARAVTRPGRPRKLTLRALLSRQPELTDGEMDVLATMGTDLPPSEWAHRFGRTTYQIMRAQAWLRRP